MKLVIAKQFFKHCQQSARASLLLCAGLREQTQRFVLKTDLDPISTKRALVLAEQTTLRIFHDLEKIMRIALLANHAHRQPPNEFRLESVLDEVLRSDVPE